MARSFIQGGIARPNSIWGPDQTPSALDSTRGVSGVGATITRIGGGLSLFVPRSRLPGAAQLFPLQTVLAVTGVDNITTTGVMVVYGTIGAQVPTLNGDDLTSPLVSAPFQTVTDADTLIYFEADFSSGSMSDQPQIYSGSSVPADSISGGTGSAYRQIAALFWDSGKLVSIAPNILYSLGYNICSDNAQFFAGD